MHWILLVLCIGILLFKVAVDSVKDMKHTEDLETKEFIKSKLDWGIYL